MHEWDVMFYRHQGTRVPNRLTAAAGKLLLKTCDAIVPRLVIRIRAASRAEGIPRYAWV